MIFGGSLLMITILSGQLDRLTRLFTPNVIGVILMLIALGLLGLLIRFMTGAGRHSGQSGCQQVCRHLLRGHSGYGRFYPQAGRPPLPGS